MVYFNKHCVTCGVQLCEKNVQYTTKPSGKKYLRNHCKQCTYNAKHCVYKYDDKALDKLSKIVAHRINNKLSVKRQYRAYSERQQKYREENKESLAKAARKRYLQNRSKRIKQAMDWRKRNLKHARQKEQARRDALTDSVIKSAITGKAPELSFADIPQDFVELKRKQLKLYRDVKKQKSTNGG